MKRIYKSKHCLKCNKYFKPTSGQQRWCLACKTLICIVWGTPKILSPSRIKRGEKFCSPKCEHIYTIKENHPTYKNYISYQKAQGYLYYTDRHPDFPKQAVHRVIWLLANPNANCKDCGNKVQLVHHEDGNKLNNNLNNLVGLCRSCHNIRHWKPESTRLCKLCNKTFYAPNKPGRQFIFCSTLCRRTYYQKK